MYFQALPASNSRSASGQDFSAQGTTTVKYNQGGRGGGGSSVKNVRGGEFLFDPAEFAGIFGLSPLSLPSQEWRNQSATTESMRLHIEKKYVVLTLFCLRGESIMWKNNCVRVFAVLMVLAVPGLANAESIALLNPSFESPDASVDGYAYGITDWNCGMGSEGVLHTGFFGDSWTNLDGDQVAFVPAFTAAWGATGLLWQDIATTFEAGYTYQLTLGLALFTHEGTAPGATVECRLHYRLQEDPNAAPAAATTTVAWDDLSKTEIREFSTSVTVLAGSPMLGCTMGVSIWGDGAGAGVDYAVDNIRLTRVAVPEPSSMVLALSAIAGLLAYAWRKQK